MITTAFHNLSILSYINMQNMLSEGVDEFNNSASATPSTVDCKGSTSIEQSDCSIMKVKAPKTDEERRIAKEKMAKYREKKKA